MNKINIKKVVVLTAAAVLCTTSALARPCGPGPRGCHPRPCHPCRPCRPHHPHPGFGPHFGPGPCYDRGAAAASIVGASVLGAGLLANAVATATAPRQTVVVQQPVAQPVVVQQPAQTTVVQQPATSVYYR